jgi:hypothetical protein
MSRAQEIEILERSLKEYKDNPILLAPFLILTLVGWVLAYFLTQTEEWLLAIPMLLIIFLSLTGLASMSAKVAASGKCELSDWWTGVRNYFWNLLAVSIIVGLIVGILVDSPSRLIFFDQPPSIVSRSYHAFTASVADFLLFVCYAAVMVDHSGPWTSIKRGWKAIRASGRISLSFLVILFIVSEMRIFVASETVLSNSSFTSILSSYFTLPSIGYTIFQLLLDPLWFLIGFAIYLKFSETAKKTSEPIQEEAT